MIELPSKEALLEAREMLMSASVSYNSITDSTIVEGLVPTASERSARGLALDARSIAIKAMKAIKAVSEYCDLRVEKIEKVLIAEQGISNFYEKAYLDLRNLIEEQQARIESLENRRLKDACSK